MLNERGTFGINGSFCGPEKKLSIIFGLANTKFCLSLNYNADNRYLFFNGKGIFKFKTDNKNANFPTQFCLESIFNGFSASVSREISFKKMCMIFQSITTLLINLTY